MNNPLLLVLIVVLLFVVFGGYGWHSGHWNGTYFGGGLGLILIVVIILALTGRL